MRCGHLCFLFCIVMSSTIDVVLKLTSFQIDPFQMAFWRFLLGGLFCLPVALHEMKKQGLGFSPSFLLPLSLSGFLCVVLSTGFHQTAIASGKASGGVRTVLLQSVVRDGGGPLYAERKDLQKRDALLCALFEPAWR